MVLLGVTMVCRVLPWSYSDLQWFDFVFAKMSHGFTRIYHGLTGIYHGFAMVLLWFCHLGFTIVLLSFCIYHGVALFYGVLLFFAFTMV